jgi:CDP-glucose 4,6-dehydratase
MTAVSAALAGKRVFLTGHTGFTGSWLALWLAEIGCEVSGYSLTPWTEPNLFAALHLESRLAAHHLADIRDYPTLKAAMEKARPEVVLHLAAQPLVRRAYGDPLEAFSTNVVGTANVLEAARGIDTVRAFVSVTTDKVYENDDLGRPFVETDRLGGKDPYSASKAAAEIVSRCYQETLASLGNGMAIATARGGNIIGGGDWSADRIVPDFYRAATAQKPLVIRYPDAVRPWQHVLSACHGYMAIAAHLLAGKPPAAEAFNIGPREVETVTVRELVALLSEHSTPVELQVEPTELKEAALLLLDTGKARDVLGFAPPWGAREVVMRTAQWYRAYYEDPRSADEVSLAQIADYRRSIGDGGEL